FLRICEQHGTRRTECDEAVLVERQFLWLRVELRELVVEPVWKACVDLLDRFADFPAAGSRPAATGLQRDDEIDAVVKCPGEQSRLPQSRMPDDGDASRVDIRIHV